METLASIRPVLPKGMWATSIDLKDTYMHIPIHPDSMRIAFCYREVDYHFVALLFGLSTGPRVFTWVTCAVLVYLR